MQSSEAHKRRLIAALASLPMVERAVYILSATDGFSHGEVAFRLGITAGEVETCLAAALLRIGDALERG